MKLKKKSSCRLIAGGLLSTTLVALAVPGSAETNDQSITTIAQAAATVETQTTETTTTTTTTTAPPQSEVEQLRALVDQLTERLNKLETDQQVTAAAVARPQVSSSSKLPITVSGLLQVHGIGTLSESGPDSRNNDTFRIRRGELRVTGRITPRITGTAMFDIAKVQSSSDRASDTVLQEVVLSYLLNENRLRGSSHYIDVGQYKVHLGYEGDLVSSSGLQTIERALMFGTRDPFRGGYGDKREAGVRVRGTVGQFQYWLGAFNGLGELQNTTANSDNKAVVGRVAYRPRSIQGLMLGLSAARGNTGNPAAGGDRLDRDVFNAFAAYKRGKWTGQTEYMIGDAQTINGALVRDVRSYYGSIGYRFTNKLEGVARYDVFDFTRGGSGGDISEATLGLNYYIRGNNAKIQANLVKRDGDAAAPGGARNDWTQFRTNFQVAF